MISGKAPLDINFAFLLDIDFIQYDINKSIYERSISGWCLLINSYVKVLFENISKLKKL